MPSKPKLLSREQFLAPTQVTETYVIPELGGAVELRSLTRQDQKDINREGMVDGKYDEALGEALTIVKAFVNPTLTVDDVGTIRNHKAGVVDRLLVKITALSGYGRASIEAAKANFRP